MMTNSKLSVLNGPIHQHVECRLENMFSAVANGSYKDTTAILFEDSGQLRRHTFAELDKKTIQLAKRIREIFLGNETLANNGNGDKIIAVKMNPSDNLLIILLAIWKTGAAYLPLDHEFPKSRIDYIIRNSRPLMMIYDEDSNVDEKILSVSLAELFASSEHHSANTLSEEEKISHSFLIHSHDLAIVNYTSGSTGTPKGVRIPHRAILNRLEWQYKHFPYGETEKTLVFKTALTFGDSIAEIWGPLLKNRCVLVVPRKCLQNPENFLNILVEYEVQRLVLVPSLLESLLLHINIEMTRILLSQLKLWVCSGEKLEKSLVEKFYEKFPRNAHKLCNFYGSTEIMADVTYHIMTGPEDIASYDKVPIGKPINNTKIYLLDNDLQPVEVGEQGEIFVAGLNLAAGYINGQDPDHKFFNNHLDSDPTYSKIFRTGDFARIVDGILFYEGRTDSQVKVGGRRVDLAEIENAVNSLDEVEKAVIICYEPERVNQTILAFAVVNDHRMKGLHIEAELKKLLVWYMIPEVVIIEQIPMLVSGKTDKQALLELYENMANYEDPISYKGVNNDRLEQAQVLFETISIVLGRRSRSVISADANFYEIGGNSLNTIRVISMLGDKKYYISIDDFLRASNLAEIFMKMNSTSQNTEPSGIQTFVIEPLKNEHKKIAIEIIARSFVQKPNLLGFLNNLSISDFEEVLDALWEAAIRANLSFVLKSKENEIIGVGVNFDDRKQPVLKIENALKVFLDFIDFLEDPIREKLPRGEGTVLYSDWVTTHWLLSDQDNIAAMIHMENEVLNLAKRRGFTGVLASNINQFAQELGKNILNYQIMLDYQANQYVDRKGVRPFAAAPDSQRAMVVWKEV